MHDSSTAIYATIDDGRGKLPDCLKIRVPPGLRADLRKAAETDGVSVSAYIREAVVRQIAQTGRGRSNAGGR